MRGSNFGYDFRNALRNYDTPRRHHPRAKVNNPVSRFNNIHIVFYNNNRVTLIDKFLQYLEQLSNIVKMKPVVGSSRI